MLCNIRSSLRRQESKYFIMNVVKHIVFLEYTDVCISIIQYRQSDRCALIYLKY